MRAWIALSMSSRPSSATGMKAMVSAGDDAERDLAAVDVAEESHRERDRLDELEHELDEADEQGDDPGADAVLELVEREELAEVAAEAELPEALDLEDDEATSARPIVMFTSLDGARSSSILPTGGTRPIQLSNRISRKNAAKIGMYGRGRRAGEPEAEVAQELVDHSKRFWPRPGISLRAAGHEDRAASTIDHDDPHREDRGADARVERDQLVRRRGRWLGREVDDDVRRRELEVAVDEAGGIGAVLAGCAALGGNGGNER